MQDFLMLLEIQIVVKCMSFELPVYLGSSLSVILSSHPARKAAFKYPIHARLQLHLLLAQLF